MDSTNWWSFAYSTAACSKSYWNRALDADFTWLRGNIESLLGRSSASGIWKSTVSSCGLIACPQVSLAGNIWVQNLLVGVTWTMSAQLARSFVRLEKPRISGQASCSRLLPRYWPCVICLVQKRHLSEASKAYSHDITSSIVANSVTWMPGPLNDVLVVVLYPCFSVTRVATSLQVRQGLEIPVIRGVWGSQSILLLYSGKFVVITTSYDLRHNPRMSFRKSLSSICRTEDPHLSWRCVIERPE